MRSDSYYVSATMFNLLVRMPRFNARSVAILHKVLKMLEISEKILSKKAAAEVEKAKQFSKDKNKRAAIQCLKRKRHYEQRVALYGGFQLRIRDEIILLEGARITIETVDSLIALSAAVTAMLKNSVIGDYVQAELERTLKGLERSLEELETAKLEQKLFQPAITAPSGPVQVPITFDREPVMTDPEKHTAEKDELAALQASVQIGNSLSNYGGKAAYIYPPQTPLGGSFVHWVCSIIIILIGLPCVCGNL